MGTRKLKPIYLFAGGRRNDPTTLLQLFRTVFAESGVTDPFIAYIGTANRDVERSFQRAAERLKKAGARTVTHALLCADTADIEKAKTILDSADLVFVSGGDVAEGMRVLNEKKMVPFLHRLHEEGKPFFGISAGSIMLSKQWVRWSDPNDDSTAKLFPCLGFAPILCDTHGEDDDWEELQIALKLAQDDDKGYGIVSGAAIKVYSNGTVEALGHPIHRYARHESSILRITDLIPTEFQNRTD